MGVGIFAVVVLSFGLIVGWRWYFGEISNRRQIMALSEKEEARAEAMGLGAPSRQFGGPVTPESSADDERQRIDGVPLTQISPGERSTNRMDWLVPKESMIEELPIEAIQEDVTAAQALLRRYWAERSWEERLSMVRDPGRVKPLMQTYYEGQMGSDPLPGAQLGVARFRIDGAEVLHFSFESSRPSGVLEVAMIRDDNGVFRLDWESLVGYCDKTFVQLRLQRPTELTLVRAVVQFDDYYNFEFSDPKEFICLKLISPGGGYSLFAYAERSSQIGEWLEREMATQESARGLTLTVAYPQNAQSDQCLAVRAILADRWLILP